ncbi:MAG: hypothetical protein K2G30_11235 [Muribaculaceae bacterium]|nr:hypothetical protein [Muribaculaceae bacterium]MDE7142258.1 hypothetical protein [Muribaculaceae bacterium]
MDKLIINPVGGLANRMRAVAAGVALSRKLGVGFPDVEWPVNADLFCGADSLFDSPELNSHTRNTSASRDLWLYDLPRKKNMYLAGVAQLGRYGLKLTDWDRLPSFEGAPAALEEAARSAGRRVLIRSGVAFYPFSRELYRSLFVPRKELSAAAAERISVGGRRVVGLHIRRTDNEISIRRSPTRLFTEAVEREISADPGVMFYLASDDAEVKAGFRSRFGSRIIVSDITTARNTAEGIREALTEIAALSGCARVYGSYWSSFSEAAAMLGDAELIQLKTD